MNQAVAVAFGFESAKPTIDLADETMLLASHQPAPALTIRCRGVRGSIPTPARDCLRHGGNTPCVEVRAGDDLLILDAGTGIRQLGLDLPPGANIHLFLSHFHWDHLQGLPYFAPLYDPTANITVYSSAPIERLHDALAAQMSAPFFPIAFADVPARLHFIELREPLLVGDTEVLPIPLQHPQGATGYRIRRAGRTLVYATDHEPGDSGIDAGLLEAARGADLLLIDAYYTPEEYEQHRGWGHGTWQHAAQLARQAGVEQLGLFHHAPTRTDSELDAIVDQARRIFPNTFAAAEDHTIFGELWRTSKD